MKKDQLFLVIAVIIVLVGLGWWYGRGHIGMQSNKLVQPLMVRSGALIPEFPRDLIFGKNAQVADSRSYVDTQNSNKEVLFADYQTMVSTSALLALYRSYATQHNYQITSSTSNAGTAGIIFGTADVYIVNMTTKGPVTDVAVTINKSLR